MTELICITCPKGCHLLVDEEHGYEVKGYGCEKGLEYGKKELTNPTRVITSTVCVTGGIHSRLPVKTSHDIPKGKIFEAMRLLDGVEVKAPVKLGQVIVPHVCGTDADWIATRAM